MQIEKKNVPDEILNKIKENFFEKFKTSINEGKYHVKDLERIKETNNWIRAFYKHSYEDIDKTVLMIDEVLLWRKEFGANDLLVPGKLPFDEKIMSLGAMFYRNTDKNRIPLLHFAVRTHKKDRNPANQVMKFIAYFMEKNYKFNVDDPIILLFDMTDAGLSNTDLELTKFVVYCLKTYYPGLIQYIIIYDMPIILNAVWKIVKALLPTKAVELVKFVDKKSIKEFISDDQLFEHMGGTDKFKYDPNDPNLYV